MSSQSANFDFFAHGSSMQQCGESRPCTPSEFPDECLTADHYALVLDGWNTAYQKEVKYVQRALQTTDADFITGPVL